MSPRCCVFRNLPPEARVGRSRPVPGSRWGWGCPTQVSSLHHLHPSQQPGKTWPRRTWPPPHDVAAATRAATSSGLQSSSAAQRSCASSWPSASANGAQRRSCGTRWGPSGGGGRPQVGQRWRVHCKGAWLFVRCRQRHVVVGASWRACHQGLLGSLQRPSASGSYSDAGVACCQLLREPRLCQSPCAALHAAGGPSHAQERAQMQREVERLAHEEARAAADKRTRAQVRSRRPCLLMPLDTVLWRLHAMLPRVLAHSDNRQSCSTYSISIPTLADPPHARPLPPPGAGTDAGGCGRQRVAGRAQARGGGAGGGGGGARGGLHPHTRRARAGALPGSRVWGPARRARRLMAAGAARDSRAPHRSYCAAASAAAWCCRLLLGPLLQPALPAPYPALPDARCQAAAAEKERVAKEKEMEVARLRALQEKVADHQSELDEARARRWQVRGMGTRRWGRERALRGSEEWQAGALPPPSHRCCPSLLLQEAKDREWRAKERAAAERQVGAFAWTRQTPVACAQWH